MKNRQYAAWSKMPALRWAGFVENDRDVPFHVHDAIELVLCEAGSIWIDVDGLSLEASPGDLLVLPAGVPHRQRSEGAWRTLCVLYSGGPSNVDVRPHVKAIADDSCLLRWIRDLESLRRPEDWLTRAGLLLAVIARLAQTDRDRSDLAYIHPAVARAVDYLQRHVEAPVLIADVASASRSSYSHLSALFRKQFGCAPLQFHSQLRLEHAAELLKNPYCTVGNVAYQVSVIPAPPCGGSHEL